MAMTARQDGSAVVTAIALTALMLIISISALTYVETAQRESGRERKRESTFVLTEGVLNTQIFLLSRQWPGTAATAYPPVCTAANATDPKCPEDPRIAASFRGPDYDRGIAWKTEVRDNPAGSVDYYNETVMANPAIARYDANGDSYLWVRSQGVLADGRSRTIVALVKAEELATPFPKHAVVAGRIEMAQQGNHTYIYTDDDDTMERGRVVVRCDTTKPGCADEGKPKHITPAAVESIPAQASAMSPEAIDQLRQSAQANGTYYPKGTCPTTLQGNTPGEIVFIEWATGCRAHNVNTAVYNTAAAPGVVVIGGGRFEYQNPTFYGLIYHVNGSDGVNPAVGVGEPAVEITGNGVIVGAVIIDGNGALKVGNNNGGPGFKGNIVFDGGARNSLKAFGTAGIVQNSFREIASNR